MSQRKNPELDAKHQAILRKMMQLPENKSCADCKGPSPRWASTNLGVFVCISCSGIHRKVGTHISQVRSINLDTWTPAQVAHFQKLGNAKAAQYFEACMPPDFRRPSSGDSTQIERFIREKYEKKRYITIENGGLGGNAPTHGARKNSSYGMNGSASRGGTQSTLGGRPLQRGAGYDDATSQGRSSLPNSYGGRFGAGASPTDGLGQYGKGGTGKFNSQRGISIGARPKNAIQRANTLKEIMNMGFPVQLAARAAEAGEGDLQRAVDWVLQNSDAQDPYQSQPEKPKQQTVVRDLLDFGDPDPAPAPGPPRPTVVHTQSLMGQAMAKPSPPKPPQDDFADFADFGAFESALPVNTNAKATPTTTSNPAVTTGHGTLSGSIASLYAQRPTTAANPISQGLPQPAKVQPMPHRPSQLQPGSPTRQSSQLTSRAFANSPTSGEKPGSIPSFTWQMGNQSASPVRTSPTLTSRLSSAVVQNAVRKNSPTASSPPPPPPMTKLSISESPVPPPPNCPPPTEEAKSMSPETPIPPDAQTESQQEQSSIPSNAQPRKDESAENKTKKEEENEDPFAALSLMALSSATAKKKTVKKPAVVETLPVQKETDPTLTSTPVHNASAAMNLDDFFG